ncbi:adenylylsulfate kinase [Clostridium sp. YIM B02515]|uniref:Adenylylsulfate kinase n=1 Tax=Clostridium rhizosphaerae TaxID=2803861 RepID=A0ABS1TEY1_9CLOT|nr:adenylylsulfate kinase [Clostridium rhizosphaerae]MBL4937632.1 adenylylsulfate kinase [Clostridium rhizosphaerae]
MTFEKNNHDIKWTAPKISDFSTIQKGDMPADKIVINEGNVDKANVIFPELLRFLNPILKAQPSEKAVISVHGGSGVGKSEIGSLIGYYLNDLGIGSYILSGDNYPHRIPKVNDAERMRVFRENGIKGLVRKGEFTKERNIKLQELQDQGSDSNPELCKELPWLAVYQEAGKSGLSNYLGTNNEIDFNEVNHIIAEFKNGAESIMLKRMGREEKELWYDAVDFSNVKVLVIEWTHGNNDNLVGVDIPILLNSTPQETLEHRRSRNRDGGTDSPFTMMVLNIEQNLLCSQAHKAKIIVTKAGNVISYDDYLKLMNE